MQPDQPEFIDTPAITTPAGGASDTAVAVESGDLSRPREHTLVVRVTFDTKRRLDELALKLDRTNSDIMRIVLRLGMPLLESLSDAEKQVVREYTDIFRKLRQMKTLRDI